MSSFTANDCSSSEMMTPLNVVQYLVLHPHVLHHLSETIWSEVSSTEMFKKWKSLRRRNTPLRDFVTPLDNTLLRKISSSENFTLDQFVSKAARVPITPRPTDNVKISTDTVLVIYEKLVNQIKKCKTLWKLGTITTSLCLLTEQEEVNQQTLKRWIQTIVRFGKRLAEQYLNASMEFKKSYNIQNVVAEANGRQKSILRKSVRSYSSICSRCSLYSTSSTQSDMI